MNSMNKFKLIYDEAYPITHYKDLYFVGVGGYFGLYRSTGEQLTEIVYESYMSYSAQYTKRYILLSTEDLDVDVFDLVKNKVILTKSDGGIAALAEGIDNQIIVSYRNGYHYICDENLKILHSTDYDSIAYNPLLKGKKAYVASNQNGLYGLINKQTRILIPFIYFSMDIIDNTLFCVDESRNIYKIDTTTFNLIPIRDMYALIYKHREYTYGVRDGKTYRIISIETPMPINQTNDLENFNIKGTKILLDRR